MLLPEIWLNPAEGISTRIFAGDIAKELSFPVEGSWAEHGTDCFLEEYWVSGLSVANCLRPIVSGNVHPGPGEPHQRQGAIGLMNVPVTLRHRRRWSEWGVGAATFSTNMICVSSWALFDVQGRRNQFKKAVVKPYAEKCIFESKGGLGTRARRALRP